MAGTQAAHRPVRPRPPWSDHRSRRPGLALPWAGALVALLWGAPAGAQENRAPAPGESLDVVEHTLDNGMRFLILERRQSPTVAFMVHYPVGSIHEHLGNTGIAHVLEHMLFKGTQEIGTSDREAETRLLERADALRDSLQMLRAHSRSGPSVGPDAAALEARLALAIDSASALEIPNEFDAILSRAGARGLNATTSHEATRYFVEMPSNRTELWFVLESARMADPVFRGFYAELDVVKEERRMRLETSPGALLQTALLAAAYEVHPYGVPVIGHASDLERLTRRQAEQYFRRYYGARNAVVSIVGAVDPDQIIRWAEAYFGGIREGAPPPPVMAEEPPQRGIRRVEVEYDAEPQLAMAWKGVPGDHPDAPALSVLAVALTGGRTSALYRRLVTTDRTALQVSAFQGPGFLGPRLFWITGAPRAPHSSEDLEERIRDEIKKIQETPPSPEVMERIRNQIRAGDYRRLGQNFQLAGQLADSEATFGDWRTTFRLSQAVTDVTPEDVQRVANTYLKDSTLTVATLVRPPAGGSGR